MDQPEREKPLGVMAAAVFFCCMTATALGQQKNEPGKSAATTNSVSVQSLLDQKMPQLEFWGNPFEKAGINSKTPVTFTLKDAKLSRMLNDITQSASNADFRMSYVLDDNVIEISVARSHP